MISRLNAATLALCTLLLLCGQAAAEFEDFDAEEHEQHFDDAGFGEGEWIKPVDCVKASAAQKKTVNKGNAKVSKFLARCRAASGKSRWCEELIRPNPSSRPTFACTYGADQPHLLIHPNEATWGNAIKTVQIIQDLESLGVSVEQIYNWWRPEPYNKNVGFLMPDT